jgi:hypothetical protein
VQHGIPTDSVFLLKVGHGRQRSRTPLARCDAPAQDRLKLLVRRNRRTGINHTAFTHKINLDHARPALTSTYICVALI